MPRIRTIHVTVDSLRRIIREKGRWLIPIHNRQVIVDANLTQADYLRFQHKYGEGKQWQE